MAKQASALSGSALPSETVRSVLGRYCVRNAVSSRELLGDLSGGRKIRIHALLPCFLKKLANLCSLDERTLLYKHTLFPVYAFFMSEDRELRLRAAMFGERPSKVAQLALWSANQLANSHREKFCPECALADIFQYGVSYWHREHQAPAVNACWKHGVNLCSVPLVNNGWDRFVEVPAGMTSTKACPFDLEFARFVEQLIQVSVGAACKAEIDVIYRVRLSRLGMVTKNGNLRRRIILHKLGELVASPDYKVCKSRDLPKLRNYCELLYPVRCYRQHLKTHLFFVFSMFESAQGLVTLDDTSRLQDDCSFASTYRQTKHQTSRKGNQGMMQSLPFSRLVKERWNILSYLKTHPDCTRTQVQKHVSTAYYWLYRYDRNWLFKTLPKPLKAAPPRRVDWRSRDRQLNLVARQFLSDGWTPSSWSEVDRKFGRHGWFTKHRNRLPKTKGLLQTKFKHVSKFSYCSLQ